MRKSYWFVGMCAFLASIATLSAQGGPPGTTVNDLWTAVAQPDVVLAATESGLFRSTDRGRTWADRGAGLPLLPVAAVDGPSYRLYAAVNGGGVWRSINGGTWERASEGIGDEVILDVAVDPNNPMIVLASTATAGAFFSDNGGAGWVRPGSGLPEGIYSDLTFAPGDSQRIFASGFGGLVESTDGGQSWQVIVAGAFGFRRVRFDPSQAETIYVATSQGLLRRTDPNEAFALVEGMGATAVIDIAVDPNDSDLLYASTENFGLLRSTDDGATWNPATQGLPRAFTVSLVALPTADSAAPTRLLAGLSGAGVFASETEAESWQSSTAGLYGASVNALAVDPSNGETAYAAIDGGGMFKTVDGGASWREAREGLFQLEPGLVEVSPADPSVLYAASVDPTNSRNGTISLSQDGGENWETILTGRPIFAVETDPTEPSTVWIGTDTGPFGSLPGLFLSLDRGGDFQGMISDDGILIGQSVLDIAVDPSDNNNLFLVTIDTTAFRLFRSTNRGQDFELSVSTATRLFGVAVDPADSQRVYVWTLGSGLLVSTDGGRGSFNASNQGLPADADGFIDVFHISFDPSNASRISATTASGVYVSADRGASWQAAGAGLEDVAVRSTAVGNGQLSYAATTDAGVFLTRDGGASWSPSARAALEAASLTNAASFRSGVVAADQIVSLFGGPFSEQVEVAVSIPLPTRLAGVSVTVTDSQGISREAPLFFVAPGQINFEIPPGTAIGTATLTVTTSESEQLVTSIEIAVLAPGLFSAAGTGEGPASAAAVLVAPSGAQTPVEVFRRDGAEVRTLALDLGSESDQFVLLLFGTGIRGFSGEVKALVGGVEAPVIGIAPQPDFVGLDQVNVLLPRSLAGAGVVEVILIVNGLRTNAVTIEMR